MEINTIVGSKLKEIHQSSASKGALVELIFNNSHRKKKYIVTYNGILFESPYPSIDKTVEDIKSKNVLGFKSLSQLRNQNIDPSKYHELFIEMKDSNSGNKIEIICAYRNLHIKEI